MIGGSAAAAAATTTVRPDSPGQQRDTAEMLHFRGTAAAGNKRPYTFASQPQALSVRAQMDRDNMYKQMGYVNIMHDKRVIRGSNFSKKILSKESPAARQAEARRRAMARKKAMDYQTRALRLHLGAPNLPRGRQNVDIQTDPNLEELFECPPSQTFGAQTEFEDLFTNPVTVTPLGTDVSTQVEEKDLFDFDTEVTPIVELLITDVLRQALREILYEDELEARSRQQRILYLKLNVEEMKKQKMKNEDEMLNQVADDHTQMFEEGEKKEKTRISQLTLDRVTDLLPKVLDELNQNGFVTNTTVDTQENSQFLPWLMEELKTDKMNQVESDDNLKSIIYDLVKHRLHFEKNPEADDRTHIS